MINPDIDVANLSRKRSAIQHEAKVELAEKVKETGDIWLAIGVLANHLGSEVGNKLEEWVCKEKAKAVRSYRMDLVDGMADRPNLDDQINFLREEINL